MAELIVKSTGSASRGNPRIDLTPMVDLGFLLITFFIFTTTLSVPKTMDINMPVEGPSMPLAHHTAMTIYLGKDHKLYHYSGTDAMNSVYEKLQQTDFHTIRKALFDNAANVKSAYINGLKGSKKDDFPFVIVKASAESQYADLVNLLDELNITNMGNYALVDISAEEELELQKKG